MKTLLVVLSAALSVGWTLAPAGFSVNALGEVVVGQWSERVVLDSEGNVRVKVPAGVAYSAEQGWLLDFREASVVVRRHADTGEELDRYDFELNKGGYPSASFTNSGLRCHVDFGMREYVTFDVLTGEVAWLGEPSSRYFVASEEGGMIARYRTSSWIWQIPRYLTMIDLTLLDAATGEPVAPTLEGTWSQLPESGRDGRFLLTSWGGGGAVAVDQVTGETWKIEVEEGRRISDERVAFSADSSKAVAVAEVDDVSGGYDFALRYWNWKQASVARSI